MLVSTCTMPVSFTDAYRDSTANFIASHAIAGPSATASAGGDTELDLPASWDWAWRGRTGTGNPFAYMTLSDEGPVGTDVVSGAFTLASTETAWRLDLVNLAGNPYFEGDAVGSTPSGWEVQDTLIPGTPLAQVVAATTSSHGRALKLESHAADWAGFNPNTTGFILDNPSSYRTNTYLLNAASTLASIKYIQRDPAIVSTFEDAKTSIESDSKNSFDTFAVETANTRFMFATTSISQTADLDDLRIVRFDIKDDSRLRLLLRPEDTTPGLVAGKYEFSLWIRRPADSLFYDDAARKNSASYPAPFATRRLTLAIRQIGFLEDRTAPILFQKTFDVPDGWTRVALRMDGGNLDRFDEASAAPVLELSVYPFNPQDVETGSVIIAAPALRFFIDGYTD